MSGAINNIEAKTNYLNMTLILSIDLTSVDCDLLLVVPPMFQKNESHYVSCMI